MKKITLLIVFLCSIVGMKGQVLNQNAGWPNASWTITGSYSTLPAAFEADPTTTANFAFDDDDAGGSHEDNIAAESPIIDLTAAHAAGETWIFATVDYGYRYLADDVLRIEYWDAAAAAWVTWGGSLPGNDTSATDNFCAITKTNYLTPRLDITAFTASQLSGFRYRIFYDDKIGAIDWNYGFCFNSPTIYSQVPPSCPAPTGLGANGIVYNGANLFWTENGSATLWNVEYGVTGFVLGTGTAINGATNPQAVSLSPSTVYQYYVQADCSGNGTSTWVGPFSFSTPGLPPSNDNCSGAIALTVNPDFLCGTVGSGTITNATASGINDAGCGGTEDDDVWFSFVATATSHRISLTNIAGSVSDMYHSLWTGADCNSLTLVPGTCSDPNTSNPAGLVIGQTYYVRVYTFTGTTGQSVTFNICVGTPPPPPVNDNCSGAIALTVNPDLSCGTVTAGTTTSATASGINDAGCGGTEDDDVWFSFVATSANHNITLSSVVGSVTDMYHSLWTGTDCGSLTLVAGTCSDPNISNPSGLVIGQTYYVRVYTFTGTTGQSVTFNICVGTPPPPPANDACIGATQILSLPYTNAQDATAATNNGGYIGTCTGTFGMNDGVWYSVVGNGSDIIVNINNVVGWDAELAVYTGTCGTFTCVGSADLGGSGGNESYTISASVVGTTYYINVGYYSGTSNSPEGPFVINVTTNLSTNSFDSASFKAYPNPVKDVLNLSYSSEISSVEVFNMLGQKVMTKALNVAQGQIDMSNLTSGNYIVKVTSEGLTKTIKVVKQ